jgi:hypothetical protein
MAWLAAGLLLWFLAPFVLRGFRFPLGPDAPVYLWWTRLAGQEGLSVVGDRPGVPAVALAAAGTLGLGSASALAALEVVLGVAVGLASAALVRTRRGATRAQWLLAGALSGLFAVHLASGYLANLAFAVVFLAAAAALADGTRRGTVAAAALLGAGGLLHPQFFLVGLAILWFAAIPSLLGGREEGERLLQTEHGRIGAALAGGGALLVGGLAVLVPGADPLQVDTSKDAFLRRAGIFESLREAYRGRFFERWPRYVQWASLPLGALGLLDANGGAFLARFMLGWTVVLVGGVAFGLATAIIPPDRFVTFSFVVPILAALGLLRLWRRLADRRPLAVALVAGLGLAMVLGSFFTWRRQEPFMDASETGQIAAAARYVAATPPGTPLLFVVDTGDPTITFFATEAANAIRAVLPPDRIRDVFVIVPEFAGEAHPTRTALARLYAQDAAAAVRRRDLEPLVIGLRAFDRASFGEALPVVPRDARAVEPDVIGDVAVYGEVPEASSGGLDVLEPSSPWAIAGASVAMLLLLGAVGYGWSGAMFPRRPDALALAPAAGLAVTCLAAIALERLGVPLEGAGALLVSVAAGAGGYLLRMFRRQIAVP